MHVDLLDITKKVPCALGEICGVVGMTFHRAIIPPRQCIVAMACVKKGLVKLPFPNEGGSKMKYIIMWHEKDVAFK
jgi:hypothetical protein